MLTSRTRVLPSSHSPKPYKARRFGMKVKHELAPGSAAAVADQTVPPFSRTAISPWLLLAPSLLAANRRVASTCCSHCLLGSLDDLLEARYAKVQAIAGADRHPRFGKGQPEKGTEGMDQCCCEEALPRDLKVQCASSLAAQTRFESVQHDASGYNVETHRQSAWAPLLAAHALAAAAALAAAGKLAEVLRVGRDSCAP